MTPTRHAATATSTASAFSGPVSRDENRAAHGNVRVTEICNCGWERPVNVNGRHREEGAWAAPAPKMGVWAQIEKNDREASARRDPSRDWDDC